MSDNFETPEDKLSARRSENRAPARQTRPGRTPQDRKPKKAPAATEIEFRGLTYDVHPDVLDDWELLEEVNELGEAGNMVLIKAYLGDSYPLVKDDLRDEETGKVSAADIMEFFEVVGEQIKNLG